MPLTLLLDLDDTLLESNLEAFTPAYFQGLSAALAGKVNPEVMIPALVAGTRAMMKNLDPELTLQQVFESVFYQLLGVERSELHDELEHFYDVTFPSLGVLTRPIPEAISLVEWAFSQGHRVVIATNPFFPLKAVQHRLRWAGLAPEKYPFALVSSFETFHFTKESVAYYPEVMAQLGWPDDPAIMVGDDTEREVKPTRAAGFPVYWVRKEADPPVNQEGVFEGTLGSLRGFLEKTDPRELKISFDSPSSLVANLRATPAGISSLVASLPEKDWVQQPEKGEWCLTEIVCHLRDVEREVNLPRIQKMLAEDNPFLPGVETDGWVQERRCIEEHGPQALADFISLRKQSIDLLAGLQMEWGKTARHAIFGRTSLQELVGIFSGHDRVHIQQIWKTLHPGSTSGQ